MIEQWLAEVKKTADPEGLGMVLVHNGVVRGTSKQGKPVSGMNLSYDEEKLRRLVREQKRKDGIVDIRVWINRRGVAGGGRYHAGPGGREIPDGRGPGL